MYLPDQAKSYEESLKHYKDLKNSHDEGYEEGFGEGYSKGIKEIILNLNRSGLSNEEILKLTKITITI